MGGGSSSHDIDDNPAKKHKTELRGVHEIHFPHEAARENIIGYLPTTLLVDISGMVISAEKSINEVLQTRLHLQTTILRLVVRIGDRVFREEDELSHLRKKMVPVGTEAARNVKFRGPQYKAGRVTCHCRLGVSPTDRFNVYCVIRGKYP